MKKVGIITLYYKSVNYGGNLQAYALCEFLRKKGYIAEQICFHTSTKEKESIQSKLKRFFFWGIGDAISNICERIKTNVKNIFKKEKCENNEIKAENRKKREKAFEHFNQETIPHSQEVYYADTIEQSVQEYDVFISGSDQVWNFKWYHPIYFLDFVPSTKKKISYAASISMEKLNSRQKQILKRSLEDYSMISVREQNAVEQLDGLVAKEVQCVLDPTLLLSREEWDIICKDVAFNEAYIFCYFLGDNLMAREIAAAFARKKGLKLIAVLRPTADLFGDVNLYDASPEEFLGYIKHAEYVFTDSFHAVVFSTIYKRQYYVFNRNKEKGMNGRITHITELFGTAERFCTEEKESLEYVESLVEIDYTRDNPGFREWKEKSEEILVSAIEG